MIEKVLINSQIIEEITKNLIILELNCNYFLKVNLVIPIFVEDKFIPCELSIEDIGSDQEGKELLHIKFYNSCFHKFRCENIKGFYENEAYCVILLKFPPDSDAIVNIEVTKIYDDVIGGLNLSTIRKEELNKIITNYLFEDYEEAIDKICVFGEYLARELAKKIKKRNMDFKTSINTLFNYPMSERTKINYNYLGSLLSPIYYIRNQKLHPYSKINIDENVAELLFVNLSNIINYLYENQIKI